MLIYTRVEPSSDTIRGLASDDCVAQLPAGPTAANASRWIDEGTRKRRLRRQRRMERAAAHRIHGWSVRTW